MPSIGLGLGLGFNRPSGLTFPDDWGRKAAIVVDNTKVAGATNLVDFPVRLTVDNLPSEMFDTADSNSALEGGGDIRFSSDSAGANRLSCHIVKFEKNAVPANGKAQIYVKAELDDAADTTIYVWYNAASAQPSSDATFGSEDVWSDYEAVFVEPLENSYLKDVTGNNRHFQGGTITDKTAVILGEWELTNATAPSVSQGVAYDGTNYYGIDTNALYRDPDFTKADAASPAATNSDPAGDVGITANKHCGAGEVNSDYLYVPICNWQDISTFSEPHIAWFDKTTLAYVGKQDISAQTISPSAISIDPSAGTNGIIYVASYGNVGEKIYKYDLLDKSYLGAITPSVEITQNRYEGVAVYGDMLLISGYDPAVTEDRITAIGLDGTYYGYIAPDWTNNPGAYIAESVRVYDGDIYWWDGTAKQEFKFKGVGNLAGTAGDRLFIGANTSALSMTYALPDAGTISTWFQPKRFYNYNTLWDATVKAQPESWVDVNYYCKVRYVAAGIGVSFLLGVGNEDVEVQMVRTWDSAVPEGKTYGNGAYVGIQTETYVSAGANFYLNGGNASNAAGECQFYHLSIASETRALGWITTEYNNYSDPATFAAAGAPGAA